MLLSILILIGAFILNLMLPWWSIAIPGLLFGYVLKPKSGPAFGWGFLALFLLWGGQAFYIHLANDGLLTSRIAELFGLGSPILIIVVTALVGGLVSGLATLSGAVLKKA